MAHKLGTTSEGKPMHYSVGAIIKRNQKYLLIDRKNPPFGFAGLAGHIDEGESPEEALVREVKEESNLLVESYKLLFEEELDWNWCKEGVKIHYWYLFQCGTEGKVCIDRKEEKSIGWYSKEEIKHLSLEKVWRYWFKKLKIV